jgi:hypothetical protein
MQIGQLGKIIVDLPEVGQVNFDFVVHRYEYSGERTAYRHFCGGQFIAEPFVGKEELANYLFRQQIRLHRDGKFDER